ncbi:MAG TPA: hypothetical protein VIJ47_05300 [Acidimicrobiales bacterium]
MNPFAGGSGTVGELLGRCLAGLGVRRVFVASPLTPIDPQIVAPSTDVGLALHPVGDAELALLLASADGRIGPGPGVAIIDGRRLVLTSAPGVPAEVIRVGDPAHLPGALAGWSLGTVHAAVEYDLDLDLDAPSPAGLEPMVLNDTSDDLLTLSPSLADFETLVLVGPGVVRAGHVNGLRALAASMGCGVVNTWGAKGVFVWDDPHHFGTVGLQARDFDLAGLNDAQLIVTAGLDPLESPLERWSGSAQVLEVEPWQLSTLAHHWPDPEPMPGPPPLYIQLSTALAGRYRSDDVPLAPARAAADLAAALPRGGLVVADPGPAGLWVARAFPTSEPGSVVVPAAPARGFAVAGAIVAGMAGRPAIGVTTDPVDPLGDALLALAERWELPLVLEVWGGDGQLGHAGEHGKNLSAALEEPGVTRLDVPVAFAETAILVEVAGEVIAWAR